MTIRQMLVKRARFYVAIATASFLCVIAFFGMGEGSSFGFGSTLSSVLGVVGVAGLAGGILGIRYLIKCPRCGGGLGKFDWVSPAGAVLRERRVMFCPYCGIKIDEKL